MVDAARHVDNLGQLHAGAVHSIANYFQAKQAGRNAFLLKKQNKAVELISQKKSGGAGRGGAGWGGAGRGGRARRMGRARRFKFF